MHLSEYSGKCFKKLRTLFFVAFAASWLYMLWRIFFDEEE